VRFQKTYRQELPMRDAEPASLVKAWSEGLGKILSSLEEDLAQAK